MSSVYFVLCVRQVLRLCAILIYVDIDIDLMSCILTVSVIYVCEITASSGLFYQF